VPVRPEHLRTFPRGRIPETVLMFIRARGGEHAAVNAAFVYAPLADFYDLPKSARCLSATDYYRDVAPGLAWDSEVNSAVKELKKVGYVTSAGRSEKSVWRLTEAGAERADFWLKRMNDKRSALGALTVNAELARPDSGDARKTQQRTTP
jgi:glycine/D-amino acid oxidase-like deaminating enzyme